MKKMRRAIALALVGTFLLPPLQVLAASADAEMKNYSKSVEDFAREFPDKPDRNNARYDGGAPRGSGRGLSSFNSNYYNRAAKSPYTKSEIMKSISTLADSLAKTAGSGLAVDSAQNARQQATALQGSSDPQFQAMGASLSKEANAIEAGDRNQAEQIANTISSMPKPYVPDSYKPTQSESALVKAFNTVIGGVIAALGGVLGGLAIAGLLKSLGLSYSFLSGSGSNLGRDLGSSVLTGGNNSAALNNTAASAVNQTGSSVNNAINQAAPKVENLPSASSGQSGSAPSAQ